MALKILYGLAVIISLLLIVGYCKLIKKKDIWFILLFVAVLVVNSGYFTMAMSSTLGEALLAKIIDYAKNAVFTQEVFL